MSGLNIKLADLQISDFHAPECCFLWWHTEKIFSFWGHCPQTPTRGFAPGPHWGPTAAPRPPHHFPPFSLFPSPMSGKLCYSEIVNYAVSYVCQCDRAFTVRHCDLCYSVIDCQLCHKMIDCELWHSVINWNMSHCGRVRWVLQHNLLTDVCDSERSRCGMPSCYSVTGNNWDVSQCDRLRWVSQNGRLTCVTVR